ncbi:MAG TPA: ABC transporter permease [Gemmatimonadaceae bacterium]|nr:ABC transporter permease [Gemmatimonadaceae bacterium]
MPESSHNPPPRRVWRESVADEVDADLAFHVEMRAREYVARGMSPEAARGAALGRFGDFARVNAECRQLAHTRDRRMRNAEYLEELRQDLRYAARQLLTSRAFTLVAVLTLALGTGANTLIFSVVNGVLLRPLPYPDAGRLYTVLEVPAPTQATGRDPREVAARQATAWPGVSALNLADWRARTRSLSALGAACFVSYNLTNAAEPEQLRAFQVSDGFFAALGVAPLLGRALTPAEIGGADGGGAVAVLSAELWRRQFHADPAVLGRAITLDARPYTVVGVLPDRRGWPDYADLWTPLTQPATDRSARGCQALARLAPGASEAGARRELETAAAALAAAYPGENGGWTAQLVGLLDQTVGATRSRLLLLLGAVAFVLLTACTNLAHMLLARAAGRRRELAVRTALGATRARIVRQLVTESLLLSAVGGAAGLALATWLLPVLLRFAPEDIKRLDEVRIDPTVLAVSVAVAVLAGLLFGLTPALRASRPDMVSELKGGGGASINQGSTAGWRARRALVVSEVALASVLLVGAGLLLRSFERLRQVDLGFDPLPAVTVGMVLPADAYPSDDAVRGFFRDARARVGALPEVEAVGAVNWLPFSYGGVTLDASAAGSPDPRPVPVGTRVITPGYLEALRVGLRRGRMLGDQDAAGGQRVVVINETMARRLFGAADPVGREILLAQPGGRPPATRTVVGVVGDMRHAGRARAPEPEMFIPHAQSGWRYMNLVVRARPGADPAALLPRVKQAVHEIDPLRPLFAGQRLADALDRDAAQPRFSAALMAVFAGLAAVLACVGIVGVMSNAVAQRTREIGIRVALGARSADVMAAVLAPGLRLVALGLTIGTVAALALTRLIAGMLFGVRPEDPLAFGAAFALLAVAGAVACYLPARRALAIDPSAALRAE